MLFCQKKSESYQKFLKIENHFRHFVIKFYGFEVFGLFVLRLEIQYCCCYGLFVKQLIFILLTMTYMCDVKTFTVNISNN